MCVCVIMCVRFGGIWQAMKAEETCRRDNTLRGKTSASLPALLFLSRTKQAAGEAAESEAVCVCLCVCVFVRAHARAHTARAVSSRFQAAELGERDRVADGKKEEVLVCVCGKALIHFC